jgi:hypothetical protein
VHLCSASSLRIMSAGQAAPRSGSGVGEEDEDVASAPVGLWVTALLECNNGGGRVPLRAALCGLRRLGFDVDPDAEARRLIEAGCVDGGFLSFL